MLSLPTTVWKHFTPFWCCVYKTSNYCNFLEFSKTICVVAWKGHNTSRRANSKTPLCKIKNSFSNTLQPLTPSSRCNFALNLRLCKHKATTTYKAGSVWTFSMVLFKEMLNIFIFLVLDAQLLVSWSQTSFACMSAHNTLVMPDYFKLQTPSSSYLWAAAALTARSGRSECGTGKSPGISSAAGPSSWTFWWSHPLSRMRRWPTFLMHKKTAKELKRSSVYLGLMRAFPFTVPSGSH